MKNIILYDNSLELQIPDCFELIEQEEEKKHYFPNIQPTTLYVDKETDATIGILYNDVDFTEEDIDERLGQYYIVLKRTKPNFNYGDGMVKRKLPNGKVIGSMVYTSTTLEKDLYTIFVLGSLNGKETTITMTFDIKDLSKYFNELMTITSSINFKK